MESSTRIYIDEEGTEAKIKRKLIKTLEEKDEFFKREFNYLKNSEEAKKYLDIKKLLYIKQSERTARRVIQNIESNLVFRNFLKNRISRFHKPGQKLIKIILGQSIEESEQLSIRFLHRILINRLFELSLRNDLQIPDNRCVFSAPSTQIPQKTLMNL